MILFYDNSLNILITLLPLIVPTYYNEYFLYFAFLEM